MSKWRFRSRADKAWIALVATTLIVTGVMLWRGYRDCTAHGGKYVRGLFWMECVK